jgi:hypothetical protein
VSTGWWCADNAMKDKTWPAMPCCTSHLDDVMNKTSHRALWMAWGRNPQDGGMRHVTDE